MDIGEIMETFGRERGIGGLVPDEDGTYALDIDGMSVAFAEVEGDRLVTWSEVCEPQPEGREHLFRALLEGMFMGEGTGGASFSVERGSGKVCLHRIDALGALDLPSFKGMLEKFVNVLEEWRRLVADFQPVFREVEKGATAAHDELRDANRGGFIRV